MKPPTLNGLILAGGQSSRMGQPKWSLDYHGKTQLEYCHELLLPHCSKIFVSSRPEQKITTTLQEIHDRYTDIGPMSGILSAMETFPETAWLVIACDLPLLDQQTIRNLVNQRDPSKLATTYLQPEDHLPEPLCSIYESGCVSYFKQAVAKESTRLRREPRASALGEMQGVAPKFVGTNEGGLELRRGSAEDSRRGIAGTEGTTGLNPWGSTSLRKALLGMNVKLLKMENTNTLKSIDHTEDYKKLSIA